MTSDASDPPERWATDAGGSGVAMLDIPPHARRDRRFEISCTLSVAWRGSDGEDDADAWHELTLRVNGRQQWQRRLATHPGPGDSLDYRFRQTVEVGETLRIVASTQVHLARRLGLVLTAEEEASD